MRDGSGQALCDGRDGDEHVVASPFPPGHLHNAPGHAGGLEAAEREAPLTPCPPPPSGRPGLCAGRQLRKSAEGGQASPRSRPTNEQTAGETHPSSEVTASDTPTSASRKLWQTVTEALHELDVLLVDAGATPSGDVGLQGRSPSRREPQVASTSGSARNSRKIEEGVGGARPPARRRCTREHVGRSGDKGSGGGGSGTCASAR